MTSGIEDSDNVTLIKCQYIWVFEAHKPAFCWFTQHLYLAYIIFYEFHHIFACYVGNKMINLPVVPTDQSPCRKKTIKEKRALCGLLRFLWIFTEFLEISAKKIVQRLIFKFTFQTPFASTDFANCKIVYPRVFPRLHKIEAQS